MKKTDLFFTIRIYQSYIIALVIFFILIWLGRSFLVPNSTKIQQILAEQKELTNKKEMLEKKLAILSAIDKEQELEVLKKITFVLSEEKDVFSIFNGLDTQEKDAGIVVTQSDFTVGVVSTSSASQKSVVQKTAYESIDISFNVLASKDTLLTFLKNLRNFKTRLFTVKDMKITILPNSQLEASFILSAFYMPFPPNLGEVDSPLAELTPQQVGIKENIASNTILPSDIEPAVEKGKSNLFQ